MDFDVAKLVSNMKEFHVVLSDQQLSQFQKYYELLIEWNSVMNLTAITEPDDVIWKHFTDSMSIIEFFKRSNPYGLDRNKEIYDNAVLSNVMCKVIDVGTGAGFPGIPIKILFPNVEVTLLDSLQKRVNFLNEVVNQLHLQKISTIHSRAEDAGKNKDYREQYDIAVSRAVSNMTTLSEYCLPFVKVNGQVVAYKSEKLVEELETANRAIHILGGKVTDQIEFCLPFSEMYRNLLVVSKNNITPTKYPRKAGLPLKEPLSIS